MTDPTPEEIEKLTAEIQSEWSESTRQSRTVGGQDSRVEIREVPRPPRK